MEQLEARRVKWTLGYEPLRPSLLKAVTGIVLNAGFITSNGGNIVLNAEQARHIRGALIQIAQSVWTIWVILLKEVCVTDA